MDYYSILDVEKNATKEEIKKSYRKKAMQYHPDRTSGDKAAEEKFKQVNEAYGILGNDEKRKQYDTFGKAWPGAWWFQWWGFDVDISDIFESFFGGQQGGRSRSRRSQEQKWEDVETYVNLDLSSAITWWEKTISYNKMSHCSECDWVGGEWKESCWDCSGSWYVTYTKQSMFGVIQQTWVCNTCNGSGESFSQTCEICNGQKRVSTKVDYKLEIPAGIDDSMVIKIADEGNDGIGTNAKWDLYVKFRVEQEEKWLKRDGNNLHYDLEIHIIEAVLWTTKDINIPIIGKRSIDIASWTQVGTSLTIKWDGIKDVQYDSKWDLFIHLDIKIPKKLGKKERELYEQIATEKKINVCDKKWIFEKIFG